MRDTHREREVETQAEGEAGSTQEPDVGLDPGTPRPRPGPKEAPNRGATPGSPILIFESCCLVFVTEFLYILILYQIYDLKIFSPILFFL